jgi:hypothetical protein
MTEDLLVACLATKRNSGAQNMINSLTMNKWRFEIFGLGQEWHGFTTKIKAYLKFIQSQPSKTILVLVDCFDALCVRKPDGFVNLFKSFNADIVVGAEGRWGLHSEKLVNQWVNKAHHGYPYVNSGFVVGRVDALQEMYQWAAKENIKDDQVAVSKYINSHPEVNVELDGKHLFVFNDNNLDIRHTSFDSKDGLIHVTRFGSQANPYFVHFPAFLIPRSLFGFSQPRGQIPLKHYDFVGKYVLGNDFIEVGQVDQRAHFGFNVFVWILFVLVVFLIVLLALTPLYVNK